MDAISVWNNSKSGRWSAAETKSCRRRQRNKCAGKSMSEHTCRCAFVTDPTKSQANATPVWLFSDPHTCLAWALFFAVLVYHCTAWYPGYGYYHYFNDYAYPYYGYGPWGFWPRKTAKAAKPVSAEMVNLNGIANEQDLSGLLNRNVALAMPDDVPASEPTKFASAQRPVISPPDHSS
ncbi:hypothetical protein T4C_7626 [Trichinella pseudospiralis]|uniref:Uncharacterized protein n=1 Tax=Trichinella pseudospiralis TaxID=6337 RepID=A0A0V1JVP6_TRIPS|nr:hypothetical protein T4C_7626 [Trichinella pseudospiralis]